MFLETRRLCSLPSIARASALLMASLFVSACTFDGSGLGALAVDAPNHEGLVLIDAQQTRDLRTEDASSGGAPADHGLPDHGVTPCSPGAFECLPTGEAKVCKGGQWTPLGPCPLGCSASSKACRVPSNVPPETLPKGTGDLRIPGATVVTLNSDTGEISGIRGASAGLDPTSGIYYTQLRQNAPVGLGVFVAKTISVPTGATLKVVGSHALVLLASKTVSLQGIIDVSASGPRAGPGGFDGGGGNQPGEGLCPGRVGKGSLTSGSCGSGSGGGGYGGPGGAGGDSTCTSPNNHAGGPGGAGPCGPSTLIPLVGGSGGGGGGPLPKTSTPLPKPGSGGGGGGAIQISAGQAITIGPGGINAGGGGGGRSTTSGGSGGGAGGAILLEAPSVTLTSIGILAANGGGGGGGDCN